ncbi:MAG: Na/Pi cotransporter family protein, partial [Gammaproteobacteria bacterium]|nr:Na/Pi cotransporter family protein [Gammaproteobacteria bacterium]
LDNDTKRNAILDELIRKRLVSAHMGTSLMNDSGYAYNICHNLIEMARVIYAPIETEQKKAEEKLALDDKDIKEIIQNKTQ